MDLQPTEDQVAMCELARKILSEQLDTSRRDAIDAQPDAFGRDEWLELARAGLLGAALTEPYGGGLGFIDACLLLEEVGRAAAPLPFLETVVMGAMTIDRFGSAAQKDALLPGVVDGSLLLTAALLEPGRRLPPERPATHARTDGDSLRVSGEKMAVPAAHLAHRILVPVHTDSGSAVVLIDPEAPGVELEKNETTTRESEYTVRLQDVSVSAADMLGDEGARSSVARWMVDRALVGVCALQAGVSDEALRLTAKHVSEREQFGQKVATFQAVAQRAADAYIDCQAISLTARQAAWLLSEGRDASEEIAAAKFWAAEAGQRVAHAAQHLHGGLGVVTDYPLFRYFRLARRLELTLGGAAVHLDALGAAIADGA